MPIDIVFLASLIGSVAFALSGFLAGARKNLDYTGIFIVSILTANGGGALRDVLAGQTPQVLYDPVAFLLVLAVVFLAAGFRLYEKADLNHSPWVIFSDAIGLVAFSITGAIVGIDIDLGIFGVMVLSFLTATGGGIIRDMLINEVPAILDSDFYGTIALLIAACLYGLHLGGALNDASIAGVFVSALILRIVAYRYGWRIPTLRPPQ